MTPTLRVLVTNAFGLASKLGEFQSSLCHNHVDVAIVSETKFTPDKITAAESTLPGYHPPLRLDRTAQGGGVAVWVRSELAVQHLEQIDCCNHEVIWLSVMTSLDVRIVICAVYRSGSLSDTDTALLDYLDSTLDQVRHSCSHIIIAGDFNVHSRDWLNSTKTTRAGEATEDICAVHGLVQHVKQPTRGRNILDLIISDFHQGVRTNILPPIGASDHAVILADFPIKVCSEKKCSRTVWRYAAADWARLRSFYRATDWQSLISSSPDEACTKVTNRILEGIAQFIPSKTLVTRPSDPAWWTPECTQILRVKKAVWKSLRRHPSPQAYDAYHAACQASCINLQKAKAMHLRTLRCRMENGSLSSKQWWSSVKHAGGEGRTTDLPTLTDPAGRDHVTNSEKAECLAKYFSAKCSLGENDLDPTCLPPVNQRSSAELPTVRFRPSAVQRLLKRLDASKATGPDGIPPRVLKVCSQELASPLAKLFSFCFSRGKQPTAWKCANVVPVYKKKSRSAPSNYRPVSLLSAVSKVMEAVVNKAIMKFFENQKILSAHQFGFRPGLGTADLLTRLHHEWSLTAGLGGAVRILAVDIAGAFDKVSHCGVLHKLASYGITGDLLNWLASYLNGRKLQVVIGGQQSTLLPICSGVPQGSLLGPTLFLAYINDCEGVIPHGVGLAIYADDTTLYQCIPAHKDVPALCQQLQTAVDALAEWGAQWKIRFEPSKSQAITISHRRHPWDIPSIVFDGTTVAEMESIQLLGVHFDQHLTFRGHLRSVVNRANQRIHFFRKAARILDARGMDRVYKGFVRPVMEYCPLVWAGASPTNLQQLDAVQRRALHCIGEHHLLPSLALRRQVYAFAYLYKLLCLPKTSPLHSLVPLRVSKQPAAHHTRRQTAIVHDNQLATIAPATARNSLLRSFPVGHIISWNQLPPSLFVEPMDLKRLHHFKAAVHKHLKLHDWEWATDRL